MGVAIVTEDFSLPPIKTSFSAGMVMDEEPLKSVGNTLFLDLENLYIFKNEVGSDINKMRNVNIIQACSLKLNIFMLYQNHSTIYRISLISPRAD